MSRNMYNNNNTTYNTMTLTGQGQVTPVPNIAVIRLGVETTGQNLMTIQAENARITQSIIQALQRMGINEVKTSQYTIDKIYDYENGNRIDRGYSVRNILEIRTNNLDMAGRIIDTAVSLGANVVDFISFDIANKDYYYQQALNLAILNATQKAKSIAGTLGLNLDPKPIRIVENMSGFIPLQTYQREALAATPIVPGTIVIEANVTIDFAY